MKLKVVLLIALSLLFSGCNEKKESSTAEKVVKPVQLTGAALAGEKIVNTQCAACHQKDGVGKVGFAPGIRNRDFIATATDEFLKATIKLGRPGTSMPARPDLSEQQLTEIIAYLRSGEVKTKSPVALNPSFKASGDAKNGALVFQKNCQYCHGEKGEGYAAGSSGPGIGLSGFLSAASDDFIFQTVKHGRMGTSMRGFVGPTGLANLTEQDVQDVIVFLRGLK